jgi:hypothetical protein
MPFRFFRFAYDNNPALKIPALGIELAVRLQAEANGPVSVSLQLHPQQTRTSTRHAQLTEISRINRRVSATLFLHHTSRITGRR